MTEELWDGFADDEDVLWLGFEDHAVTVGELRRDPELARKILAPIHGRVTGRLRCSWLSRMRSVNRTGFPGGVLA
jgi:hypothetical protein